MPLYLFNEAKPFIRFLSSCTGSLLSPDNDESRKPIFFGEKVFWHEILTLLDHLQLCLVNKLNLPLHTAFIALTDDGYDEIHKNNVPDNQNKEQEEPCQDLEFF
jgi:hypothetical protein